jgi:hypothetical protein
MARRYVTLSDRHVTTSEDGTKTLSLHGKHAVAAFHARDGQKPEDWTVTIIAQAGGGHAAILDHVEPTRFAADMKARVKPRAKCAEPTCSEPAVHGSRYCAKDIK